MSRERQRPAAPRGTARRDGDDGEPSGALERLLGEGSRLLRAIDTTIDAREPVLAEDELQNIRQTGGQ